MKFLKLLKSKLKWILLTCVLLTIAVLWFANYKIEKSTDALVYTDVQKIPHNKVGLLLGTSKLLKSGAPNQYFTYRITAAVELFKSGKIDYIVISGDNSSKEYNEPMDMKNDLMAQGIPEGRIFLDYAGFRTLDSVVRISEIFGQESFTIISQDFHNRRAIFIARQKNLKAIGFNAKDVNAYYGFKTKAREKLARVKVFVDLITQKEPKYLGKKIMIK